MPIMRLLPGQYGVVNGRGLVDSVIMLLCLWQFVKLLKVLHARQPWVIST